ncbi:hypothetical protein [Holdemanella biformis]|uniref:hypothetical protein n=1 Tax=Holdemanella biformis TaxID=1735 RepID=UPI0022E1FDA6|nr:hypothetical protein [Holdemanella biformis]
MTLDEAIAIAKESSENQYMGDRGRENFKQLAAWLEELKQYKEEKIQETNLDHFKHEILEDCVWNLAVVKGRPKPCNRVNCHDCKFYDDKATECYKRAAEWLKQPCTKSTYKLTKFEFDLLKSYSKGFLSGHEFESIPVLSRMKEKGYFKGIDKDAMIEDILADCEVTEED